MKLPCIIASDLHLTANPNDEYRWGLLPWLAKQCIAEKAQTLAILGDLTDQKDLHPAELVNRVVQEIDKLRAVVPRIVILMGNHDWLRKGHCFFEFLNSMPGVEVITKQTEDIDDHLTMWLPFTRTPLEDWKGQDFSHYEYLMLHATISGAMAESGQALEGDDLAPYLRAGKVYSGDVHVPQLIGGIEYVGAPYHIRFGDNFKPRCIVIESNGKAVDLHYQSPRRVMLDVTGPTHFAAISQGLEAHDQVKVRVALPERDKHLWRAFKAEIEALAVEYHINVVSIELRVQKSDERVVPGDLPVAMFDPVEQAYRFVEMHGLGSELLDAALECMKEE